MDGGEYRYEENVSVRDTAKKFQRALTLDSILSKNVHQKKVPGPAVLQRQSNSETAAAVIDVEITEINSGLVTPPGISPDASNEIEVLPPVDVKTLLQKFSNGMSKTFRRNSIQQSIDPENTVKPSNYFPATMPPPEQHYSTLTKILSSKSEEETEDLEQGPSEFEPDVLSAPTGNGEVDPTPIAPVKETKETFSKTPFLDTILMRKPKPCPKDSSPLPETPVPREAPVVEPDLLNKHRNGTILLLGLSQSGKSTLVNHLLQQDLCTVYKSRQLERQMIECRAAIQDFGSIVLLDTPGFTNNLTEDACLCAILSSYFCSDETRKIQHPDLVLVLLNYESHFLNSRESQPLQNFLRIVFHYHSVEFKSKPAIQFVMTHSTKLSPTSIARISKEFTGLVRNSTRVVIPPSAVAFHARDATSHPQDLFQTLCQKSNPVWNGAFGPNYPKSLLSSVVSNSFPLPPTCPSLRIFKTVESIYKMGSPFEQTELSLLLEIGWENIELDLRSKYPLALVTLQQLLNSKGLKTFDALPADPIRVLELLHALPSHDPTTADLFTETLQVRIPSCYAAQYIGQGYDVSKDQGTRVTPFEFSGLQKTSAVGLLPEEVSCRITDDREIIFKFYEAFDDYVMDRFEDLGLAHVTLPKHSNLSPSGTSPRRGYNVINPNDPKTSSATATIEYRLFQLFSSSLEEVPFKTKFWKDLTSLRELDVRDPETLEGWEQFFSYWGTHVVKSAYGGGAIDVNFRGKVLHRIWKGLKERKMERVDEFETTRVFQWITGDGLDLDFNSNKNDGEFLRGFDVDSKFTGGDIRFQQQDLTKLSPNSVAGVRNGWIQTLPLAPVILESNLGLVATSYFVRMKSEELATKMDNAFFYFYKGFMVAKGKGCTIL